jgi:RHS repeat-associated protein
VLWRSRATAEAGATSTLAHFDPYGAPRPGGTASSGIGFAGEYRDGTGLVNLRARSYDPVLGRFIGRDTFGGVAAAPQSANRYAYALANPLRYTDPSGQFVNNIVLNPNTYVMAAMMVSPAFAIGYMDFQFATGYDPVNNRYLSGNERIFNGALAGLGILGKAIGFLREALAASDAMAGTRLAGEAGGLIGDASAAGSAAERIGAEAAAAERAGAEAVAAERTVAGDVATVLRRNRAGRAIDANDRFIVDTESAAIADIARPYIRAATRRETIRLAYRAPDGTLLDANTFERIEGDFHFGHKAGSEWWRIRDRAAAEAWSRQELNDFVNNPDIWQIETPANNLSHLFEMRR